MGPFVGPDTGGDWWPSVNGWYQCPIFTYASGFNVHIDKCCGAARENTGLNDLELACTDPNGEVALRLINLKGEKY